MADSEHHRTKGEHKKHKSSKKRFVSSPKRFSRPILVLVILIAAALGVHLITNSRAATITNTIDIVLNDSGCPTTQQGSCTLVKVASAAWGGDIGNRNQPYLKHDTPTGNPGIYYYDWGQGPVIQAGTSTSGARAMVPWLVFGKPTACTRGGYTNSAVQVNNMQAWIFRKSQNQWIKIQDSANSGFPNTYWDVDGGMNLHVDAQTKVSGNDYYIRMVCDGGGGMAHIGMNGRGDISAHTNDVGGLYVTIQARLTKWDANGVDDTGKDYHQYLLQTGNDWYPDQGCNYPCNTGSFEGKFKYVSTDWQSFSMVVMDSLSTAGGYAGLSSSGYNTFLSTANQLGIGSGNPTPPQPPQPPSQPPQPPQPPSGSSDVIVTSINTTPVTPKVGDAVSFNAVIKNIGSTATPAGTVIGVDFSVDGVSATCGYTSTSLAAGATVTITPSTDCANLTTWTATTGNHAIVAFVDDINRFAESNENNNTLSKSVTVGTTTPTPPPADTTKPTVSITSPANNATVSGNIIITINASDNVGVSKVEVFQGATLLGNATASGGMFTFSWPTSTVGDGTYSLTAKATDIPGNNTTSTAVSVKVSNVVIPPPVTTLPDVVVTSVVPSIATPRTGDALNFIATIKNQGSAAVAAGSLLGVGFGVDGANPSASDMWGCANTTLKGQCNGLAKALLPGDSITVTSFGGIKWTATLGSHKLTAHVNDVAGRFTESSTSNNILADQPFSVTAPGDTAKPSVPTNLATSTQTVSAISLNWTASTDNVGVTGYKVYRNGTLVGSPSAASYTDSGLNANTAYSYAVSAIDLAGNESNKSTVITVRTKIAADTTAPTAPTNLVSSAASPTRVNLTWSPSTDAVGVNSYIIQRKTGSTSYIALQTINATTCATTCTYADNAAAANTTYQYRVIAVDVANNNSASSNIASATTPNPVDTTSPTLPTSLSASPIGPNQVNLTWVASTDNVGVVSYDISRGGVVIANVSSSSCTPNGVCSYGDASTTPGTTYTYTIIAKDSANLSSQAAIVSVTTPQFSKRGDINNDVKVDEKDMSIVLANWNKTGSNARGDVNADGIVDERDLSIILANYGR